MLRPSIKRRLIFMIVLSQLLLALGLLLTGVFYTRKRLISALDASMQGRAISVAALVRYNDNATGMVYFDETLIPPSLDPDHPDLFAVWTERSSKLLAKSANWPEGLEIDTNERHHWDFKWAGIRYRGLRISQVPVLDREEGQAFTPETLTIVYASPTHRVHEQVRAAGIFIALTSLVLLGITVWLALWGVARGLLPLQQLAAEAAQISAQNWQLHLPEDAKQIAELRPLTESMTTMLARLERSFTQQREFLGNATHELKTPVAVLKSTLQSLLHRPRNSEEYRAGIEQSLDDMKRLEQLLEWMLRLARAEQWAHGALRRDLQVIDVGATCEESVERMQSYAQARNMQIHLATNGKAQLRADPEDLQLVWTNLLENAIRYSPEGQAVEVSVANDGENRARIVFEDHGAGISAQDLPHIFERFYRGDPSRTRATGGFGLGLAIAKALVEAYGGSITAESQAGQGTRMTVELPVKKAQIAR